MAMQLKVPSIACGGCADTITKAIKTHESEADVQVDVENKLVTVDTKASEESIKQVITAAGHTVE
ncbi:MAG: heavy-metal-associated domain-containing protein [Microcoleaceae cyanobacterium MO_207.B10]|nr:heavy-metal-associated domain-containing protein [Microcoleaceae cyanobacterium MO_207.B10]